MTIGSNYTSPVIVNGYACKNCTDVAYAKKYVDPSHPEAGPFAKDAKKEAAAGNSPSDVIFGGSLAGLNATLTTPATGGTADPANVQGTAGVAPATSIGSRLNIFA